MFIYWLEIGTLRMLHDSNQTLPLLMEQQTITSTYDHRTLKIELPVRSAVLKQCTGGLVVRWVTTGEYPLLYVFGFFWSWGVVKPVCGPFHDLVGIQYEED
jgi:hypothetical protein